MCDGNLLFDRLPTLRLFRSVGQKFFQFREFFGAGQRLNMPRKPCPVILLTSETVGRGVEYDGNLSQRKTPEQCRVLSYLDP